MNQRPSRAIWFQVRSPKPRDGSAAVLIIAMMFVFVALAAFTVDSGYMQLVRTELRAATDAAAKAGAEALSRTQDPAYAKSEAIRYAAANQVAGAPFKLSGDDIELGRVQPDSTGKWNFQPNGTPLNAVQVRGRTGDTAAQPAIPLFFGGILGKRDFSPVHRSTAGQQEVEICICLDRSGSMTFDMSGNDFSFAPDNPLLIKQKSFDEVWQNLLSPPHPKASRWSALRRAVDVFLDEVGQLSTRPRTGLVTWSSNYTMPVNPYTEFAASKVDIDLPASSGFKWSDNATAIRSVIGGLGEKPVMGGTNMAAGLDDAIRVVQGSNSNKLASKVIILLTDGQWNEGRDPLLSAGDARAAGIIVHCVSMLTDSQDVLEKIANITGGRYWGTRNEAQLRAAFVEIANSLPIVLTD